MRNCRAEPQILVTRRLSADAHKIRRYTQNPCSAAPLAASRRENHGRITHRHSALAPLPRVRTVIPRS